MPLIQFIYFSKAVKSTHLYEVKKMVELANLANHKRNITGFLCANPDYFLQCLEGEETCVLDLYRTIEKDPLHRSLTIIQNKELNIPFFKDWGMGAVLNIDAHNSIIEKYGNTRKFDPTKMSTSDCLGILKEFSRLRRGLL